MPEDKGTFDGYQPAPFEHELVLIELPKIYTADEGKELYCAGLNLGIEIGKALYR